MTVCKPILSLEYSVAMANRRRKKIIPSTGSESDANATLSDLNEEQMLMYSVLNEKFQAIFARN